MTSLVRLPGTSLYVDVHDVSAVSTTPSDVVISLYSDKGQKARTFSAHEPAVKAEKIVEFINKAREELVKTGVYR